MWVQIDVRQLLAQFVKRYVPAGPLAASTRVCFSHDKGETWLKDSSLSILHSVECSPRETSAAAKIDTAL